MSAESIRKVPTSPAAPPVVRAASLDRAERRSFLADIVIEHGPRDVLGRLFLKADTALRRKGVFVSFTDFDEFRWINRQNPESWRPLLPIFDPTASGLPDSEAVALVGRDANGRAVFAQSSRVYHLAGRTLKDEIESLRLFYRDPRKTALPGEAMHCSAPIAEKTCGKSVFNGALWLHPDFRKLDIPAETVQISRGVLFTRWGPDMSFSFMAPGLIKSGLAKRARLHVEWEVTMINTPILRDGTINAALVWLSAQEQIQHFADYMSDASSFNDAEVNRGVTEATSENQRVGRRTG